MSFNVHLATPWIGTHTMGGSIFDAVLKRQQDYVTADGRFASQLAFDITTVPEAASGREVEKALSKIVEAAPGWSAIAGGRLAFKTKLQLKSLKGLGMGPLKTQLMR